MRTGGEHLLKYWHSHPQRITQSSTQKVRNRKLLALLFSNVFFVYLFLFLPLTTLVVLTVSNYVHSFRPKWFPRLFLFYFCTFTGLAAVSFKSNIASLNSNIIFICVRRVSSFTNKPRLRGWLPANHRVSRQEFRAV